jgi:hypothetical protein
VASGRRGASVAQGAQPRGGVACAVAATADRSQTLRVAAAICRYCARSIPLRQRTRTASGTRACDLFGKELRFHARQYACAPPMRSWVYCWRGAIEHTTCGARRTYVEGLANKNQAATHSTLPQSASQGLVPCMHDHDRLVLLHFISKRNQRVFTAALANDSNNKSDLRS